jgi:hypothetical protein
MLLLFSQQWFYDVFNLSSRAAPITGAGRDIA